jgi:hypothetical protein
VRARLATAEVLVLNTLVSFGVPSRLALEGAFALHAAGESILNAGLGAAGVELALGRLVRADAVLALSARGTETLCSQKHSVSRSKRFR